MQRLLVTFLVVVAAAPARADEARARAAALYDEGKVRYQAGDYVAAAGKFTEAYEIAQDPVYLFNIAQSYRNAADCKRAYDHYQRFLAEEPAATNADSVRTWLRELEPCAKRVEELERQAKRVEELERRSASAPVVAESPVALRAPSEREIDRGRSLRLGGLALVGGGGVALLAGIVYGVKSEGYQREVAAACARGCAWEDVAARDEAGRAANTRAWIGYVVGGLAIGGGAGLYVLGTTRVDRVTISPAAGGAQVSASLRF